MTRKHLLVPAVLAITFFVGCAGPRPNLSLEEAETAYNQAQRDPNARKYAPQALKDAQRYLEKAQAGWEKGFNQSNVYFYANLSRRYAETALVQGANLATHAENEISGTEALKHPELFRLKPAASVTGRR